MGRQSGLSEEKLAALPDYATSALFSDRERAVLELADAMSVTPAEVPRALFDRLRAMFSEPQLVELSAVIAWENYRSRFNRTFDVQSDGFSEGAFCAVPARGG